MKTEDSLRARVAPTGPVDHLGAGHAALGRGDWQAARLASRSGRPDPGTARSARGPRACRLVARFGRSRLRRPRTRVPHYREQDDGLGAARMAVWLAWDTVAFRGEHAVANGWLQRAHRLLEGRPDSTEHAWLALRSGVFALLDDGDPAARAAARRRGGADRTARSAPSTTRWSAARSAALPA